MDDPIELLTHPYIAHAVIAAWMSGSPTTNARFLRPEHFFDRCDRIAWTAALELDAEDVTPSYRALRGRLMGTVRDGTDWNAYCERVFEASPIASTFGMQACARAVFEKWRHWRAYELGIR